MDLVEQQAITALKEGSESAFEILFKTYYRTLCNYAYSLLNDRDEAEEIVQSTFITLWDRRHSIEIQTSVKSYLYRMIHNSSLNVLKHGKVKQAHAIHTLSQNDTSYGSASETLISNELEQKISEAIKALPEQCRLVFQLSRFEEMKYAEIADQLEISVKTVENHMGKALKIMRTQLKDYLPFFLMALNPWIF